MVVEQRRLQRRAVVVFMPSNTLAGESQSNVDGVTDTPQRNLM